MKLFLFSNSFPQGNSETFLENEIPYLSNNFEKVIIIPLQKKAGLRKLPTNIENWDTILNIDLKDKSALIKFGLFNFSPVFLYLKEFFLKKVFLDFKNTWSFFTSLLLFRAIFSKKKIWQKFYETINNDDLVYFYWGDKSILILPYLKKNICNKTYVRFHRTDLYEYARNGYIPFRKIVFPYIDWFLPISEDGKNYLLNNYPELTSPQKIKVCRLGVLDHGLNSDEKIYFHLLSCSSVVPIKRISLIIDALKQTDIKIRWTHIGNGPLYNTILEKAKMLNSNIDVNMLGTLTNTEVINYYRQHHIDLFINVSESEGVPVSIMEALSFGIPVFATNVGGTSEIVDNRVGELLSPDITDRELTMKIVQFTESSTYENFRINARKRWEDICSAEKNYGEFIRFLRGT